MFTFTKLRKPSLNCVYIQQTVLNFTKQAFLPPLDCVTLQLSIFTFQKQKKKLGHQDNLLKHAFFHQTVLNHQTTFYSLTHVSFHYTMMAYTRTCLLSPNNLNLHQTKLFFFHHILLIFTLDYV